MATKTDTRSLIRLYQHVETRLVELIAEAVRAGTPGSVDFYQKQQEALRVAVAEARRTLIALDRRAGEQVSILLVDQYAAGMASVGAVPATVGPATVGAIAAETITALRSHHTQVLRRVQDAYRDVIRLVAAEHTATGQTLTRSVQAAVDDFARRGVTGFTDAAGRRWSLDTYADMAIRTASGRATMEGRMAGWRDLGVDLVLISQHPDPAPMCAPFQGRVLTVGGLVGPRVVEHPDGSEVVVQVAATMRDALEHGYRHANCRHTEVAYMPGMDVPEVVDVDPEAYEATQRLRAIERRIREWKRIEAGALTPGRAEEARRRVRAWQGEARRHVGAHAHLSRRPEREQVRAP